MQDPCLPANIRDLQVVLKQSFAKCNSDPRYWFILRIISDGNNLDFTQMPRICWSVFLKKGKQHIPIWQYHKFSDELLRNFGGVKMGSRPSSSWSFNSCRSHVFEEEFTNLMNHQDLNEDPVSILNKYLKIVVTNLADFYIKEAKKNKWT